MKGASSAPSSTTCGTLLYALYMKIWQKLPTGLLKHQHCDQMAQRSIGALRKLGKKYFRSYMSSGESLRSESNQSRVTIFFALLLCFLPFLSYQYCTLPPRKKCVKGTKIEEMPRPFQNGIILFAVTQTTLFNYPVRECEWPTL